MKKFTCKPKATTGEAIRLGGKTTGEQIEFLYLGRLAESGAITPVYINVEKPLVIAIVGKRGSGKSYTLGSIAESLCTKNLDSSLGCRFSQKAQLLFDTLGIFQWTDVMVTTDSSSKIVKNQAAAQRGWSLTPETLDTAIWVPKGMREPWMPSTHGEFSIAQALLSAEDWGYLLNLDISSDVMGQLLADIFAKVTEEGWAEGSISHPPQKETVIEDMIKCATSDNEITTLYQSETRRALTQRLSAIKRLGIFDTVGTSFSSLLKPGQLSILVLNKLADSIRLADLTSLVRTIMRSRIESSEAEKQQLISGVPSNLTLSDPLQPSFIPPCWIEIDEAQNILPSERKTSATDTLVKLVREGRNFGISFVITTQQPSSIDQRIMAQVDILIVHKLAIQSDIDYVSRNIKSRLPDEVTYGGNLLSFSDVIRSLDTGQALISDAESDRAYLVDIRPRISVHGGFAK